MNILAFTFIFAATCIYCYCFDTERVLYIHKKAKPDVKHRDEYIYRARANVCASAWRCVHVFYTDM